MTTPKPWRLKAGSDRRFRTGHPWIYSNELASSPKGIAPGDPIELQDAGGKFLAWGFGNPHSLISFRAMSRKQADSNFLDAAVLRARLEAALQLRETLGMGAQSHRWCFGEADGLPGLILDRFLIEGGHQLIVIQAHTAGMDRLLPTLQPLIAEIAEKRGGSVSILIRNDVSVRKLDGLSEEPARLVSSPKSVDLTRAKIVLGHGLTLMVNLSEGQKTGFFLDQSANIDLTLHCLRNFRPADGKTIRILDLCTYVGQWGASLARHFSACQITPHVVCVDSSQNALSFAQENIRNQGADVDAQRLDVLHELGSLPGGTFDLVISDPPALIKNRKDSGPGTHAYLQLHTQAMRLLKPRGLLVACSCSALLPEEDFLKTLAKAALRNQREIRWIARGGQAPDHPVLAAFPEGRYLKCWIGAAHE